MHLLEPNERIDMVMVRGSNTDTFATMNGIRVELKAASMGSRHNEVQLYIEVHMTKDAAERIFLNKEVRRSESQFVTTITRRTK